MIETRFHLDSNGKGLAVERVQDVEEIIEGNKSLQSVEQKSDWGRHVARIPCIFLERWLNEEWARGNTTIRLFGEEFDKIVAKKLADPEWRFLRVDK